MFDIRTFKNFPQFKERFLSFFPENAFKPGQEDACWEWQGNLTGSGYGRIYWGIEYLAHQVSYLIFNSTFTQDQIVRHTCDNPKCVNPKHLILGSFSDNSIDIFKRNRSMNKTKLTINDVKEIKRILRDENKYGTVAKLAKQYGVTKDHISRINNNRTWYWVTI